LTHKEASFSRQVEEVGIDRSLSRYWQCWQHNSANIQHTASYYSTMIAKVVIHYVKIDHDNRILVNSPKFRLES
jgi:hypothetical protein